MFRFNNPEEVRKQRDRQKHLSVAVNGDYEQDISGNASPATRPDSPVSSADVDWNYAKREAALRLAGVDPDSMPDDQLDMLYEKITKVKTLRGKRFEGGGSRPESSASFSHVDDMWSEFGGRPIHSSEAMTDDTSMENQNGQNDESGSMAASTQIREMQGQLEAQRLEFENRLQAISEGGGSGEAEDLKVEKENMEKQLVVVQAQMKRLLDMRGRGKIDEDFVAFEPVIYNARQLRLIRRVLDKWRAHRAFSMAETVLSNAVVVKEANIIRWVLKSRLLPVLLTVLQYGTQEGCCLQFHYCRWWIISRANLSPGHDRRSRRIRRRRRSSTRFCHPTVCRRQGCGQEAQCNLCLVLGSVTTTAAEDAKPDKFHRQAPVYPAFLFRSALLRLATSRIFVYWQRAHLPSTFVETIICYFHCPHFLSIYFGGYWVLPCGHQSRCSHYELKAERLSLLYPCFDANKWQPSARLQSQLCRQY